MRLSRRAVRDLEASLTPDDLARFMTRYAAKDQVTSVARLLHCFRPYQAAPRKADCVALVRRHAERGDLEFADTKSKLEVVVIGNAATVPQTQALRV